MDIETSNAVKLKLTALDDIDYITVYLEEIDDSSDLQSGNLRVEYGCSEHGTYQLNASFGSMGTDILSFVEICDTDCLAKKLKGAMPINEVDLERIPVQIKKSIIRYRLLDDIGKEEARKYYDRVDALFSESVLHKIFVKAPLSLEVEDFLGFITLPQKQTSDFTLLLQVVERIQSAVSVHIKNKQFARNQDKVLTGWVDDEHCSFIAIEGADLSSPANRVAFIEKTPRIRIAECDTPDTPWRESSQNWHYGPKGCGDECGRYQPSRDWCAQELRKIGYKL